MHTQQTEYVYALGYHRDFGKMTGTWGYYKVTFPKPDSHGLNYLHDPLAYVSSGTPRHQITKIQETMSTL